MARIAEAEGVEVYRSGPLYLVQRGPIGRLVNPESGRTYGAGRVSSILAHCGASEPWQKLDVTADLPDPVATAAAGLPDKLPDLDEGPAQPWG